MILLKQLLSTPLDNVTSLAEMVRYLQENRESENLKEATLAYVRVANLARKAPRDKT